MSIKTIIRKILKPTKIKLVAVGAFIVLAAGIGASVNSQASATGNGYNCDSNAVVYCGADSVSTLISKYDGGDGYNQNGSISTIYNYFNINSSDIHNMPSNTVEGYVTKSGDVFANSQEVATGALTGGRSDIAGSTYHDINGTVFYSRPPAVSFLDNTLPAMVVFNHGVFQFAILNSCGNPIEATAVKPPVKHPNYTILKQVRASDASTYMGSIVVEANTAVQYKITVKSVGDAPVENVKVRDSLPSNIQYIPGSLAVDGNHFNQSGVDQFFGASGVTIPSLAPGDQRVYTFSGIVGPGETTNETCKWAILDNTGVMWASGLDTEVSHAYVNKQCPPPHKHAQTLVCSDLIATAIPGTIESNGDTTYNLTATAAPTNGATISSYTFDLGTSPDKTVDVNTTLTTASTSHVYAPGTYTVKVTVHGVVDGKIVWVSSADCTKQFKVPKPHEQTLVCSELTATPGTADSEGNTPYSLVATASATNGAKISGYTFDLGVKGVKAVNVNTSAGTASTSYIYPPSSNQYTVKVTVHGTLNGKTVWVSSADCTKKITASKTPVCTAPNGNTYPVGSPLCTPTCTTPSGQVVPAGSPQCVPGSTCSANGITYPAGSTQCLPPSTLVNTGPGDIIGAAAAVTFAGALGHWYILKRKALGFGIR